MSHNKLLFCFLLVLTLANCTPVNNKPHLTENNKQDSPDNLLTLLDPDTKTVDQAFSKANEALKEKKYDRALFYFVKVLQFDNNNIRALQKIAAIHKQQKNDELAEKIYQDILVLNKNDVFANEYIGLKKLKRREISQAKELLNRVIQFDARRWKSHNALGVIADLDKDYLTAIHHYTEALTLKPGNVMLLNNLGYSHYLSGNELAAKKYFNHVLSLNNKYQRAIFNLALIEIKNQEFSTAANLFDRVMEPHESFNNIGYVCMLNGQYDSAELYFRKAISESPYYFPKAQENLKALSSLRLQVNSAVPVKVTPITKIKPTKKMLTKPSLTAPLAPNKLVVKKTSEPEIVKKNTASSILNKVEQKQKTLTPSKTAIVEHSNTIDTSVEILPLEDTQPDIKVITEELEKTKIIDTQKRKNTESISNKINESSEPSPVITPSTNAVVKIKKVIPKSIKKESISNNKIQVPSEITTIENLKKIDSSADKTLESKPSKDAQSNLQVVTDAPRKEINTESTTSVIKESPEPSPIIIPSTDAELNVEKVDPVITKNESDSGQKKQVLPKSTAIEHSSTHATSADEDIEIQPSEASSEDEVQVIIKENQKIEIKKEVSTEKLTNTIKESPELSSAIISSINAETEIKEDVLETVIDTQLENTSTTKTAPIAVTLEKPATPVIASPSRTIPSVDEQQTEVIPSTAIIKNKESSNKTVIQSNDNPKQSTEEILKSIQQGIKRSSKTPLFLLDPNQKNLPKDFLIKGEPDIPLIESTSDPLFIDEDDGSFY